MSGGHRPRADHTHTRRLTGRHLTGPATRPRPAATLSGGPLDTCTVRADRETLDTGTLTVPGHAGRYVRTDADQWTWEADHHPDPEEHPMPMDPTAAAVLRDAYDTHAGGVKLASALAVAELLTSGTRADWRPADPCNACGSTQTVWSDDTGAACLTCHRTDADE